MAKLLLISEYAKLKGVSEVAVRQKIHRGYLPEAQKIGKVWFIPEDAEYIDGRIKSGKYIGWREKTKSKY